MKLEGKSELFTTLVKSLWNMSQNIHRWKNCIVLWLGRPKGLTIHIVPHNLVDWEDGPDQVYFQDAFIIRKNSKWLVLFSKYNIVYVSQKAIKNSTIVEFLADQAT